MLEWLAGDPAVRDTLELALADATPLAGAGASGGGRSHLRAELPSGSALFLKRFALQRPPRGRLARRLGLTTAQREWRALAYAHGAGVAVPTPRALVLLPGGDLMLATDFVAGPTLDRWLPGDPPARRDLLRSVGSLVCRLHAAGLVHRDLHAGNVIVSDSGPVLVDLQAATRSHARAAQRRDVGALDHSVSRSLSVADRLRLGAWALGIEAPFGPADRRRLRLGARAAEARARTHARSRTRHSLRPGRRFAELRIGGGRGLRLRELDPGALERALQAHAEAQGDALLKLDHRVRITAGHVGERRVVIKEHLRGGALRNLADLWRSSPARRAWRGGHGLLARGIGAATPLAFVERRVWGQLQGSLVMLEDIRPATPADAWAGDPETLLRALSRMLIALHRAGVSHGDLKANNVLVESDGGRLAARLVDLEQVRFPRRLTDAARMRALAELNAALPDRVGNDARHRAFLRYAATLPFRRPSEDVLARIVEQSLARAHRWSGGDCARAARTAGGADATPATG